MARKTNDIITTKQIEDLYKLAAVGDKKAELKLRDINRKLAHRANQRMRDLKKSGFGGTGAITRAKDFIDTLPTKRTTFLERGDVDIEIIAKNLDAVAQFLRYQTSSIVGEKTRRERILAKMVSKGRIEELNEDVKDEFLNFLDSDMWQELKHIDSREFVKEAAEKVNSGAKLSDLEKLWEKYKNKEMDVFEVWDNWVKIEKTEEE